MLLQRVLTAVVLLALLLPALFAASPLPFAGLTLVFIGAAGWEWARLNGGGPMGSAIAGIAVATACGVALDLGWSRAAPAWPWWLATLLWPLGGALVLSRGPAGWPRWPRALRWIVGGLLLWVAWLALANARTTGINFILSVFCLVWVADIAAYFGGRAFGRRKLAPAISPGKSWEGVWSGMAGVVVLAIVWAVVIDRSLPVDSPSLYGALVARLGWAGLVGVVVLLAALSVVGDLFESLVKRAVGAKDSSRLLPGHGGVLDRIDALLPVFPIALAMTTL
jgi:phosphatidate cytidylyltransferase